MKRNTCLPILMLAGWGLLPLVAQAQDPVPSAILQFHERGPGVKGYGEKVTDILFAHLVAEPELWLVEREEMDRILSENELNLSGMVDSAQAVQVGQLIGAKILITGSVIEADRNLYLVAKIIGTETSRVLGAKVSGRFDGDLGGMVEDLAAQVSETISARSGELIADVVTREDIVARLNEELGDRKRPSVLISVEERHVGQAVIDPAAETELSLICQETGFETLDPDSGAVKKADILIKGEGFSEFAMRRGNLVSVKARLEIKAVNPATDEIIASDRQTAVVVDLSEQIAGKSALQEAAAKIAERLLPKLTEPADK